MVSVFAGQDLEATARFRQHIDDIPPSSPCFAYFKNKDLVAYIPKHRIEGREAFSLALELQGIFEENA
ncbi:BrxA/BrxB family bacilliredoxin [Paraflavitalea speifideaquila]|uniref:BrxA/BrxB family bacilliredoxin n=1 Tax=Paraflavitalea speifideaquila TaxID=3076558 RepID=UPI0028EE3DF6|nr:BrxA/BrxB family bacilliredoxin [Paraflavitalea speifideiaquila]